MYGKLLIFPFVPAIYCVVGAKLGNLFEVSLRNSNHNIYSTAFVFEFRSFLASAMEEGRSQPWKRLVISDAKLPHHEHKIALVSEDAPPFKKGETVIVGGVQTEVLTQRGCFCFKANS